VKAAAEHPTGYGGAGLTPEVLHTVHQRSAPSPPTTTTACPHLPILSVTRADTSKRVLSGSWRISRFVPPNGGGDRNARASALANRWVSRLDDQLGRGAFGWRPRASG
jgi:hypothetical protein